MEIYARLVRATKHVTLAQGMAGTGSREGDEATRIELTYSTTGGISRAKRALGTLVVCIIQVARHRPLRPLCDAKFGSIVRSRLYDDLYIVP